MPAFKGNLKVSAFSPSTHREPYRPTRPCDGGFRWGSTLRNSAPDKSAVIRENGATNQNASSRTPVEKLVRDDDPTLPLRYNPARTRRFKTVNDSQVSNDRPIGFTTQASSSHIDGKARSSRTDTPRDLHRPSPGSKESSCHTPETTIEVRPTLSEFITFKDGEPPQGRNSALISIAALIENNLKLFKEDKIGRRPWNKSDKKSDVYTDDDREVIYFSDHLPRGQESYVSRYTYGSDKQFLVAWVPDPLSSGLGLYLPHVFGECIQGKQLTYEINDTLYCCHVRWTTWVPSGRRLIQTVFKFVSEAKTSRAEIPGEHVMRRSASEQSYRPFQQQEYLGSRTSEVSSTSQSEETRPFQRVEPAAKRRKLSDSWSGHRALSESHEMSDVDMELPRPSSHTAARSSAHSGIDTRPLLESRAGKSTTMLCQQDIYPSVVFVFIDWEGIIRGKAPFDECKTAKDLFDVACIRDIASASTRLLQVKFDVERCYRIRADHDRDFEEFVRSELEALTRNEQEEVNILVSWYR